MVVQLIKENSTAMAKQIELAVDTVGYKAKPTGSEIGKIRNRLSGAGSHQIADIKRLADWTAKGLTIQGALLRDKLSDGEDTDSRFIKQQVFAVDIDNTGEKQLTTTEEIQSICAAAGITPAVIAESFSSSDSLRKYHAFFVTDKPIEDVKQARGVLLKLQGIFDGIADPACKDPARIVFGTAPDKNVYITGGCTPIAALTQQQETPEQDPAKPAPQRAAKSSRSEYFQADPDVLLTMIDVNQLASYEEWFSVACSYKAAGGSTDIFNDWNAAYCGKKFNPRADEKAFKAANGRKHTIATLKRYAQQHSPADYAAYIAALSPDPDEIKPKRKAKQEQQSAGTSEAAPEQNQYNKDGTGKLSEVNLRNALEVMGISVKFNIMLHNMEISGKCLEKYDPAALPAILPVYLYDRLQHHLKGVTTEKISGFINNILFSEDSMSNPILYKIDRTQWDGSDKLHELYDLIHIPEQDTLSRQLLKKWLMQCYCALHNDISEPFSSDEVLVLVGKQGFGKTRLLEKLSLNRLYFGEGMTYDPRNKDSQIQAVSKWITELGEIGSTMKKDLNMVKAFISQSIDEYRVPYGKTALKYPRRTCFCGSTNDMRFLIDETGNRRFLTVKLPDDKFIDVKSDKYKKFNVLQLWAQIKHIVDEAIKTGESYASAFRLTREEQEELELRNSAHTKLLKGEEEIRDILSLNQTPEDGFELGEEYITVTTFKSYHSELNYLSSESVGKVLKKLGYTPERKKLKNGVYTVYKLPYRKWTGSQPVL